MSFPALLSLETTLMRLRWFICIAYIKIIPSSQTNPGKQTSDSSVDIVPRLTNYVMYIYNELVK